MIHISFFSSFSFHFLPLFLFRMPQTGSSPVCGLLFCTYAKNRRTAQGSSPVRLSKKSGTVKISQQIKMFYGIGRLGFCVPYFRSSPPILSLRGGRVRPTRQSLTMRFVIPKRNMVGRNVAADLMFFVISIPFCYVLPCFATGCHTFTFKIATAALRPRNDTKLRRFLLAAQEFGFLSSEQLCSLPANRSRQFAGQFYFSCRARACLLARCSCRP